MATIYLTDEIVERIDKLVNDHNEKNPVTDRSAMLHFIIDQWEKNNRKK